jgi:hypothetical protein
MAAIADRANVLERFAKCVEQIAVNACRILARCGKRARVVSFRDVPRATYDAFRPIADGGIVAEVYI